jgi:hypothetical protein
MLKTLQVALIEAGRRADDLLDHEPDSAVGQDFKKIWEPRIVKASQKGKREANNFPLFFSARSDERYQSALGEVLGPEFTVKQEEAVFGGLYTEVSW